MVILYAASEAVPFIKTGGLGDVAGTLPVAMANAGEKVYVIMPLYRKIDGYFHSKMQTVCEFYFNLTWRKVYCGIKKLEMDNVTFLFVDNEYYFGREYVYGEICHDECERFSYFCTAVLESLPHLELHPDIIHCNDWQCGFIPYLAKVYYNSGFYCGINYIYTIHNILYQGRFPDVWVCDCLPVRKQDKTPDKLEFYGDISFMKAGCVYADKVSTVSPTYAQEVKTGAGEGLDGILAARDIKGILNGIDKAQYNPYDDIHIEHHFDCYDLSGKAKCKESLQYEMWLDREKDTPLFAIVSRLTEQKGLYLIEKTWEELMKMGIELAVIGTGDKHFEDFFKWLSSKNGGRVSCRTEYSEHTARRIYAGSDFFLMPSRTEPCGLAQLIAMRYGTVPVVHETGGLCDTITPYNMYTGDGTGFSFRDYNEYEFINAIKRAISVYKNKDAMDKLVRRDMQLDFSWKTSARAYKRFYLS